MRNQIISKKAKKKPPKKRKRIATIQSFSIPNQLRKARDYPIKQCFITEDWRDRGMCNIYILREKPDHNFVLGVYLIDMWCLGLKDTFWNPDLEYSAILDSLRSNPSQRFVPIDPDLAQSIIYGGIDYAKNLGFAPHRDFKYSSYILDPKEQIEFDDSVEFGKDGKSFFFAGPYDSREKINRIIAQLEQSVGKGNFNFTYPHDADDLEFETCS